MRLSNQTVNDELPTILPEAAREISSPTRFVNSEGPNSMNRAIAILLLACSATSFTLIFTHWHGVIGSAFLGMVGSILLVSSLRFLNAKSDFLEPRVPTAMRTGRLVIVTSLSSLIAALQTLMMHEYRSQVLALIFTAICWIWVFRNIAKLFGFTNRGESRNYDGRITTTDSSE